MSDNKENEQPWDAPESIGAIAGSGAALLVFFGILYYASRREGQVAPLPIAAPIAAPVLPPILPPSVGRLRAGSLPTILPPRTGQLSLRLPPPPPALPGSDRLRATSDAGNLLTSIDRASSTNLFNVSFRLSGASGRLPTL